MFQVGRFDALPVDLVLVGPTCQDPESVFYVHAGGGRAVLGSLPRKNDVLPCRERRSACRERVPKGSDHDPIGLKWFVYF